MKIRILIIICFLNIAKICAQNDSLKTRKLYLEAIQFDSYITKIDSSGMVRFDSIIGVSKKYKHKIRVETYFKRSKTKVDLDYYFNDSNLYLVLLKEQSPADYSCWLQSEYYFEDGNIFMMKEKQLFTSDITQAGTDKIKDSVNSYNTNLDNKFIQTFIFEVLKYIRTTANRR